MEVGHRQVVHEDLSSGYTYVCGLFIGEGWEVVVWVRDLILVK